MSTSLADVFNNFNQVVTDFSEGIRTLQSAAQAAFAEVKRSMTVSYEKSREITQAAYSTGAAMTMPKDDNEANNGDEHPKTLKDLAADNKLAIAALSPLVGIALLASLTVVPMIVRSSNSFIAGINQTRSLATYDLLSDNEKKRIYIKPFEKKRFIPYAAPGYILGVVAGAPILTIKSVGRMVSDNVKACIQTWLWVMRRLTSGINFGALEPEEDITNYLNNENAKLATKIWRVGVGSPGALLGLVAGVICALSHHFYRGLKSFILHTARSFLLGFRNVVNPLLPADINVAIKDNRKKRYKFGVGIVGLLAGGLFGFIPSTLITVSRVASNSLKAFGQTWLWLARLALSKNNFIPGMPDIAVVFNKKEKTADDYWRLAGGLPLGGIPGLLVGSITAGIILACRGIHKWIKESITSFVFAYCKTVNPFLPAGNYMSTEDNRDKVNKGIGSIGFLLGGLLGLMTSTLITVSRVVSNNLKAFAQTWLWLVRLALPENETLLDGMNDIKQASEANGVKERANYRWRFASSFLLGIPAGLVAGSITAGIILACRGINKWIKESITSFIFAYRKTVNPFLPAGKNIATEDNRDKVNKGIGSIGFLLGGLLGGISDLFIALGRVASNNLKAFAQTWLWLARLALPENETLLEEMKDIKQAYEANGENERANNRWRFGSSFLLGIPAGLIVGGVTAGIILACRGINKWINESIFSCKHAYLNMINLVLPARINIGIEDNRDKLDKGIGSLGLFPGAVVGFITSTVITVNRIVSNSLKAFGQTWLWLVRLALPKKAGHEKFARDTQDIAEIFTKDGKNADHYWRLIAGFPSGIIPGFIVGSITAAPILAFRITKAIAKNSILSFMALSKSYLNFGTGRALFEGVGADDRSNSEKACGSLGYVLATVTVGLASALTYVIRKATPVLGLLTLAAAFPLVFVCKLLVKMVNAARNTDARFAPDAKNEDPKLMRLKTLYSSLSFSGHLPGESNKEGCNTISDDNATGNTTWKQFLGRCTRFNIASSTEIYLDMVKNAYLNDQNVDLNQLAAGFLNKKREDTHDHIFNEQGESLDLIEDIRRMTEAVNNYITTGQYTIAQKKEPQAYNTSRLFFHRKVEGEGTMDSTNSLSLSSSSSSD